MLLPLILLYFAKVLDFGKVDYPDNHTLARARSSCLEGSRNQN